MSKQRTVDLMIVTTKDKIVDPVITTILSEYYKL